MTIKDYAKAHQLITQVHYPFQRSLQNEFYKAIQELKQKTFNHNKLITDASDLNFICEIGDGELLEQALRQKPVQKTLNNALITVLGSAFSDINLKAIYLLLKAGANPTCTFETVNEAPRSCVEKAAGLALAPSRNTFRGRSHALRLMPPLLMYTPAEDNQALYDQFIKEKIFLIIDFKSFADSQDDENSLKLYKAAIEPGYVLNNIVRSNTGIRHAMWSNLTLWKTKGPEKDQATDTSSQTYHDFATHIEILEKRIKETKGKTNVQERVLNARVPNARVPG